MKTRSTLYFSDMVSAKNWLLKEFSNNLKLATPLGLGKPNQLLNLIYQDFKADAGSHLKIYTALSLCLPSPQSSLEKKFLQPFLARHFGTDYPSLDYALDAQSGKLPEHIEVHEFYMQAAQNLRIKSAQRHYTSLNYTHVAQNLLNDDLQVIVQLIAKRVERGEVSYSLSCNPDLTLDVVDIFVKQGKPLHVIGVIHPDLPFLGGDAEVGAEFFDAIVQSEEVRHELFALPRSPLDAVDHAIGLYASQLIEDGGTLQIGIGSLSDAIIHSTLLRHQDNEAYLRATNALWKDRSPPSSQLVSLHADRFREGLYGTSEMIMDAFMHLRKGGILVREIFDLDESKRRYLHGAFFLGSKAFYAWLRNLTPKDYQGLAMTRVSKVNDLYDSNELALRRQRTKARFFNTCMTMNLLGGAASETLENGQVISGVGGQYNFVAMSHELPDSTSVLLLRAVRHHQGKRVSNIVWSQGMLTIPRHLRDVVITEYGIACLKGRSDEEVIKALIEIADSAFQAELVHTAKKNGKLSESYEVPVTAQNNTQARLKSYFLSLPATDFSAFPFGSDFTKSEENLALALLHLKSRQSFKLKLLAVLWQGLSASSSARSKFGPELERMNLEEPKKMSDWIYQKLILASLIRTEAHRLD